MSMESTIEAFRQSAIANQCLAAGFAPALQGGNWIAWQRQFSDGTFLVLTEHGNEFAIPASGKPMLCALIDIEGEASHALEIMGRDWHELPVALAWAERIAKRKEARA